MEMEEKGEEKWQKVERKMIEGRERREMQKQIGREGGERGERKSCLSVLQRFFVSESTSTNYSQNNSVGDLCHLTSPSCDYSPLHKLYLLPHP